MIKGTVITTWKVKGEPTIQEGLEEYNRPGFVEDYPLAAFDDITASDNSGTIVINFICNEVDFSELQDDPRYTVIVAEVI